MQQRHKKYMGILYKKGGYISVAHTPGKNNTIDLASRDFKNCPIWMQIRVLLVEAFRSLEIDIFPSRFSK